MDGTKRVATVTTVRQCSRLLQTATAVVVVV